MTLWRRFWCWAGRHYAVAYLERDDDMGDLYECIDCKRRFRA
jgi:hypothetical protein